MGTVVVGLGNSLLGDDGVGIRGAALLRQALPAHSEVSVVEARAGGLTLMELLVGHRRALIIDAMVSGTRPPGTIAILAGDAPEATRNLLCAHDGDLAAALAVGRDLGLALPHQIEIIGVEAENVENFSERLSGRVAAALPELVRTVLQRLGLAAGSEREGHS